jgi:hypothetical protein
MSSSVLGLSIDCGDTAKLAQFWVDVPGSTINSKYSINYARMATQRSCSICPDWNSWAPPGWPCSTGSMITCAPPAVGSSFTGLGA